MRRAAFVLLTLFATTPALAMRGVVEGYYGRPWSGGARRDVIRYMGKHGLDTFLYGPKNDEFHRDRWREPYPVDALDDLARTARVARRAGVRFVYGLSPVLDVCYSCDADFEALTAKLTQMSRVGVRRFAMLLDDAALPLGLRVPEDVARYAGSDDAALARAQADLVNRVQRWLRAHRRGRIVLLVPSDYAGTECRPYHADLERDLVRGMPVVWTGPGVFAETITADGARERARCHPRHPVVLWDNYPVNDTVVSNSIHLGPITGRDAGLPHALGGYLLNPMTQPYASLIALGTAAAYLRRPARYDPERAWQRALEEAGGGGVAVLAEQVRSSALDLDDAGALAAAVGGVASSYADAQWTDAVDRLEAEERRQAAAPGDIAARLGDTPLAAEIAPWVDELAGHAARGLDAVRLLRALKPGFRPTDATPVGGSLRVRGRALPPDAGTATVLGPGFAAEALATALRIATPPLAAFVGCLGPIQGADIRFCPEYGLNVHGKSLYLVIRTVTDIAIVSDRNVHDRLILLAGAAYDAWNARRGPGSDALTVTVAGMPVALAGDGTFDVTVAPVGDVEVVVSTAVGERTAVVVP